MQKKAIKIIIFDLDDTLYEEKAFVEKGFEAAADYLEEQFKINKKEFFEDLKNILREKGRGHIFDIALRKYNLYSKKNVDKLVRVYRFHRPKIKLYPGLKNLLKSLRKKYKLGIITDGMGNVQRIKVKTLGIENLFDLIIYTDDFNKKRPKPNPYSFKKVLEYFKVSPEEAIYIGDDPYKDFVGAKKVGIGTVRVLQGRFKNIKAEKNFQADYEIKKISELAKKFKL